MTQLESRTHVAGLAFDFIQVALPDSHLHGTYINALYNGVDLLRFTLL